MIGFSIAAPVGPIGVLCIRRTLSDGRAYGLVSGLGAAAADTVYGCIAGFGLTFVSNLLIEQQRWLRLGGGIFLCYLGLRTLLSRPHSQEVAPGGNGLFSAFASTFFLTLTNPITIISFAGIFAGLGIVSAQGDYFSAGILVAGVFLGSGLWWFILSNIVSFFRTQLNSDKMGWINRLAGIVIAGFGLLALFNTI